MYETDDTKTHEHTNINTNKHPPMFVLLAGTSCLSVVQESAACTDISLTSETVIVIPAPSSCELQRHRNHST